MEKFYDSHSFNRLKNSPRITPIRCQDRIKIWKESTRSVKSSSTVEKVHFLVENGRDEKNRSKKKKWKENGTNIVKK